MTRTRKILIIAGLGVAAAGITFAAANTAKTTTTAAGPSKATPTVIVQSGRETVTMPALPPVTVTLPPTTITVTATAAPAAPAAAGTTIGQGVYKVGDAIPAGRYKTGGAPSCYWARLKNDSGDFAAITANGNLGGPGSVTIKAGEFFEVSGSCTWTPAK